MMDERLRPQGVRARLSRAESGKLSVDLSKTVSVVIGASGGIGQAIAVGLAGAGSLLIAADLARVEETLELVRAAGGEAHAETVDVTSPESVKAFADRVTNAYGAPTVLVNSAGAMVVKPAFDLTVEEWDRVHSIQLRGPFLTCQAFGRGMAQRGYGKIINLSSTWAVTVDKGRSAYCAAKAGVSHLTAALACEWAPLGIRVNAIAPVATRTPASELRMAAEPGREAYYLDRIPLGRLAVPDDVVGAALFFASTASDFITGETLFVDGGWRTAK
jgi:2-deoxy-D-gluconate 3-dehydrogenase